MAKIKNTQPEDNSVEIKYIISYTFDFGKFKRLPGCKFNPLLAKNGIVLKEPLFCYNETELEISREHFAAINGTIPQQIRINFIVKNK